jgi:hypothetical protein
MALVMKIMSEFTTVRSHRSEYQKEDSLVWQIITVSVFLRIDTRSMLHSVSFLQWLEQDQILQLYTTYVLHPHTQDRVFHASSALSNHATRSKGALVHPSTTTTTQDASLSDLSADVCPEHRAEFTVEIRYSPPAHFQPQTWCRYRYNYDDIRATAQRLDSAVCWQMSMLYGFDQYDFYSVIVGVKPSYQSYRALSFISRRAMFDHFIQSLRLPISTHQKSILCHARPDHRPLLPLVYVSPEVFRAACMAVPAELPSLITRVQYQVVFPFRDVYLVPLAWDPTNRWVEMCRVVWQDHYERLIHPPTPAPISAPITVRIQDGIHHMFGTMVLTSESCFFGLEEPDTSIPTPSGKKRPRS